MLGACTHTHTRRRTHTHTYTHRHPTPLALTYSPKACQVHLYKTEKQAQSGYKEALSRLREGKSPPHLEAPTMCYKGMGRRWFLSPPCTAHNRPGILQIRRSKLHSGQLSQEQAARKETEINNNALLLAHQS